MVAGFWTSSYPTQSLWFGARRGDELPAAGNAIYPSDSLSLWFTSQGAHRWRGNVPSALLHCLLFSRNKRWFFASCPLAFYLPFLVGQTAQPPPQQCYLDFKDPLPSSFCLFSKCSQSLCSFLFFFLSFFAKSKNITSEFWAGQLAWRNPAPFLLPVPGNYYSPSHH